jgi:hypothetical protein
MRLTTVRAMPSVVPTPAVTLAVLDLLNGGACRRPVRIEGCGNRRSKGCESHDQRQRACANDVENFAHDVSIQSLQLFIEP